MRKAILYVSPEILHNVLDLPDEIEIVATYHKPGSDVAFLLSGESFPDTENWEDLPIADVTIHRGYVPFTRKSELSINGQTVKEKDYFL